MPSQQYAFTKDGPKRLELSWGGFWKGFSAKVDGVEVIAANGSAELKAGKSAVLPDGSRLSIQLQTGFAQSGLAILRDGRPLPGTSSDPEQQVKLAGGLVYFLAGLNLVLGIVGFVFDVQFLKDNLGYGAIVIGVLFGALGYFTMKRSLAALVAAIVIYALDGIVTLAVAVSSAPGHTPGVGGIVMRVFFLAAMIRGAKAIRELNAAR